MNLRLALLPLFCAGWMAGSSGCAGYRVGTMLPPDIRTVFVPTVENRTDEPLIEAEVTRAIISQIQLDGSLRISNDPAQADAVLNVTLRDYRLVPVSYQKRQQAQPTEYRIILTAAFAMTENRTGKVLAQSSRAEGDSTAPLSGDMSSAKRAGLPDAARRLAHDIVEKMVETWM